MTAALPPYEAAVTHILKVCSDNGSEFFSEELVRQCVLARLEVLREDTKARAQALINVTTNTALVHLSPIEQWMVELCVHIWDTRHDVLTAPLRQELSRAMGASLPGLRYRAARKVVDELRALGCDWTFAAMADNWRTTCGKRHSFIDTALDPKRAGIRYCPYCGGKVHQREAGRSDERT